MPHKPGAAIITRPETKRLRAMGMLARRVQGWSLEAIGEEYRCHSDTVQRHLEWAAREGKIVQYEEDLLSTLVPKALKALEKALDNDDVFVAKDILQHVMKMSERIEKRQEHVEELTLNAYLKTRQHTQREGSGDAGPGHPDQGDGAGKYPIGNAGAGYGALPEPASQAAAPAGAYIDAIVVSTEPVEAASPDGASGVETPGPDETVAVLAEEGETIHGSR